METDDTPIQWTAWAIVKTGFGLFIFVVAVFAWGVRNPTDPYGAMAAMYAICAASMLFITSLQTQKTRVEKVIDPTLRVGGMCLAFLSGGFWLRSEIGELTGLYLGVILIVPGLLTAALLIWLLLSTTVYNMLWAKFRNRSRHRT